MPQRVQHEEPPLPIRAKVGRALEEVALMENGAAAAAEAGPAPVVPGVGARTTLGTTAEAPAMRRASRDHRKPDGGSIGCKTRRIQPADGTRPPVHPAAHRDLCDATFRECAAGPPFHRHAPRHDRPQHPAPVRRQRQRLKVRRGGGDGVCSQRVAVLSRSRSEIDGVPRRAFLVVVASHLNLLHERGELLVRLVHASEESRVRPHAPGESPLERDASHGVGALELAHEVEARRLELVPRGRQLSLGVEQVLLLGVLGEREELGARALVIRVGPVEAPARVRHLLAHGPVRDLRERIDQFPLHRGHQVAPRGGALAHRAEEPLQHRRPHRVAEGVVDAAVEGADGLLEVNLGGVGVLEGIPVRPAVAREPGRAVA